MSSSPEAMSVPEPPARTASESSSTPSQRPVTPHAHSAHGRCPAAGAEPHDYCPPQRGDSRSPCPALNTLANHGYLPRDGKVITPSVLIHALREGYHLSYTLAWFLTHGGFYLLGQRRKRICLQDLSRHNCIEHDASLVHPDVGFRDEYAPIEMHLHMLEDLMRYSKDGVVMTPDDVARARVAREAAYTIPMDKIHAEIARGEMAIVLQLFNNPENYAHPAPSRPSLLTRVRRLFTAPSPSPPPPRAAPGRAQP
ncbi:heme-thiolate peroxidase, partial [Rhodofomes roseus]